MAAAKKRTYSPKALSEAVDRYFASIRRTVPATEKLETGEKGSRVVEEIPILSDLGEPIYFREYIVAPTLWGLCEALGISPSDWAKYCDPALCPKHREAVQRAAGLMREWKEQALLTRKDVRGVIYHMQNHLGGLDELPTGMEETVLDLGDKGAVLRELGIEDGDG